MDSWSPFGKTRRAKEPRTSGRRRQRLQAAPGDPDAILTDRDAAHAAETAMHERTRPQAAAWERFGSQPVNPVRRQHEGDDRVLRLAEASQDHCGRVIPADTSRRDQMFRTSRAARDYGTGPAYDISGMS